MKNVQVVNATIQCTSIQCHYSMHKYLMQVSNAKHLKA